MPKASSAMSHHHIRCHRTKKGRTWTEWREVLRSADPGGFSHPEGAWHWLQHWRQRRQGSGQFPDSPASAGSAAVLKPRWHHLQVGANATREQLINVISLYFSSSVFQDKRFMALLILPNPALSAGFIKIIQKKKKKTYPEKFQNGSGMLTDFHSTESSDGSINSLFLQKLKYTSKQHVQ